jgi:hypothetical protein
VSFFAAPTICWFVLRFSWPSESKVVGLYFACGVIFSCDWLFVPCHTQQYRGGIGGQSGLYVAMAVIMMMMKAALCLLNKT